MFRLALLLALSPGCAGLLGIEDLEGDDDNQVEVAVFLDRLPAAMVDVIGHRGDGTVSDQALTDSSGRAAVAIPERGLVSVLIEISPGVFELRTWADLVDGDVLVVTAEGENALIPVEVTTSSMGATSVFWHVAFAGGDTSVGSEHDTPAIVMIARDSLDNGGTLTAMARLRSGNGETSSITAVDVTDGGPTALSFGPWQPSTLLSARAPDSIDGQIVFGVVRNGRFYLSDTDALDPQTAFRDEEIIDREFADVIAVGYNDNGERVQTDFLAVSETTYTLAIDPLSELTDASVVLSPRPTVSWSAVEAGDSDSVLATLELFDTTNPDRTLVWRVEADPVRREITLPEFPAGLAADPHAFAGFTAGAVDAIASDAHAGYRALRAGGVGLRGNMASQPPLLSVPGRIRSEQLDLPAP